MRIRTAAELKKNAARRLCYAGYVLKPHSKLLKIDVNSMGWIFRLPNWFTIFSHKPRRQRHGGFHLPMRPPSADILVKPFSNVERIMQPGDNYG
jgi:hypothetical protein